MRNEILAETVSKLKAERDNKIMEQLAKVQNEVIMPKFAEFDAKRDAAITAEDDRHSRALISIQDRIKAEKKAYEEKVQKTKLEMFVDSSYNLKSHEETFLSSVLACIEKNIGNQDFTVEALASHACMTRGNLHLKLKNLTGKTPVELIKTMRMKRACELMKETDLSIADIAEQTGFQTPGYFITVFKNHFGETPGHYASRVRQQ